MARVGGGKGWDFPLFYCLPRLASFFLTEGGGEQLGVIGRWGWLGNLFSPFSLLASPFLWRRGRGRIRVVCGVGRGTCFPHPPS